MLSEPTLRRLMATPFYGATAVAVQSSIVAVLRLVKFVSSLLVIYDRC